MSTAVCLASNVPTTLATPVACNLVLPVEANKKYLVRVDLTIQNSNNGCGVGLSGPAGATVAGWRPANIGSTRILKEITSFGTITTGTDGGSVTSFFQIWAYITVGSTAGNIGVLFGSTLAGATTTLFAGSSMWIDEVGSTV